MHLVLSKSSILLAFCIIIILHIDYFRHIECIHYECKYIVMLTARAGVVAEKSTISPKENGIDQSRNKGHLSYPSISPDSENKSRYIFSVYIIGI